MTKANYIYFLRSTQNDPYWSDPTFPKAGLIKKEEVSERISLFFKYYNDHVIKEVLLSHVKKSYY